MNGRLKVAAWVWWLLCGALLISFPPHDETVNDLLLLLSALPLGLAYGVPYWRRVYVAYREGKAEKPQEPATARR